MVLLKMRKRRGLVEKGFLKGTEERRSEGKKEGLEINFSWPEITSDGILDLYVVYSKLISSSEVFGGNF